MRLLGPLVASSRVAETIDERLMRCGVSRRAFLQFCSTLMVAAPFGLAITDKKTPEEVAAGLGKVIRPPVIWLHFQDCTGCTETLLRTSHPDLGDLILNIISLEYHETLMAGSGSRRKRRCARRSSQISGKYVCVVEGSIPTRDKGVYMKLAGTAGHERPRRCRRKGSGDHRHRFVRVVGRHSVGRSGSDRRGRRG